MKEYDITIIGGGPGGYVAAIKAAQLGASVALIEKSEIGGVCLNWGCIPTKALLKSASVYKTIMNAEKYGVDIKDKSSISINWDAMQKRKNGIVKKLTGGVKGLLDYNKIDTIMGYGKVIDKNTVEVNGEKLKTKHLILATGSSSLVPPIDGIKEAIESGLAVTSETILSIQEIPKELVVIGGGVIGVEFVTLFATLGTKVTIVERLDNILINTDQDIQKDMTKILKRDNVEILTKANAKKFHKDGLDVEIDGKIKKIKADKILVSVGRTANMKDLDHLGLKTERGAVVTNEKLETSVKGIYAIGDMNGKLMLAHVASAEGIVAVENIMGKTSTIDYHKVPSCIYSFPEIGFVGYTEQAAKEKGHDIKVSTFPLSANGKALAEGYSDGFIKIIADKKYGEILGVHILAPNATDMIAESVTTMELEGTIHELAKSIHPHPTLSEIVMEAAQGAIDKPIHYHK